MIERHKTKGGGQRMVKPENAGSQSKSLHPGTAQCETCGNEYDKPIEIVVTGISHYFDCFECAIHKLAPVCEHCGCRIIGHGIEASGVMYCCAHCAQHSGVTSVADRAN